MKKTDVIAADLLATYLRYRYAFENLTENEIASVIPDLKNLRGLDYNVNKEVLDLIYNGCTIL